MHAEPDDLPGRKLWILKVLIIVIKWSADYLPRRYGSLIAVLQGGHPFRPTKLTLMAVACLDAAVLILA